MKAIILFTQKLKFVFKSNNENIDDDIGICVKI